MTPVIQPDHGFTKVYFPKTKKATDPPNPFFGFMGPSWPFNFNFFLKGFRVNDAGKIMDFVLKLKRERLCR
jgi:hypothetical protein